MNRQSVNTAIANQFTLGPFGFERKGGALGAGDYDLPWTAVFLANDDLTTGDLTSQRAGLSVPFPCRITGLGIQFKDMDATVTVYMRKNGVKTTIGTVSIAEGRRKSFTPTGITCAVADDVLFGFTVTTYGNYTIAKAGAFIRQI
jgi:hypothetical protein